MLWEAVEHAGPGQYDEEYLAYLAAVVAKAAEFGIQVYIDPHQDVWSRWTGGSGAPAWTLEAAGFDLMTIEETGAALTHQHYGDPLPKMIWGTNNWRLATATMFTLFFALSPEKFVWLAIVAGFSPALKEEAANRDSYQRLEDAEAPALAKTAASDLQSVTATASVESDIGARALRLLKENLPKTTRGQCNEPGQWKYFLSHVQRECSTEVVMLIGVSVAIFRNEVSPQSIAGCATCLVGVALYNRARRTNPPLLPLKAAAAPSAV